MTEIERIVEDTKKSVRRIANDMKMIERLMEQTTIASQDMMNALTALNLTMDRLIGEIKQTEDDLK